MVEETWPAVLPTVLPSLLNLFSEAPELTPRAIIRQVLDSKDVSLRELIALDTVAEVEPGWLVARREQDPAAERALLGRSLSQGILFFATGFYSPTDLTFHTYSQPPGISARHQT